MGQTLTLDAIRAQIEASYGPLVIDLGGGRAARMLPVLRLPRARRTRVSELLGGVGAADPTNLNLVVDSLAELIRAVCETDQQADWLLAELEDDGQALQHVFGRYQEATGLGDPSPSES